MSPNSGVSRIFTEGKHLQSSANFLDSVAKFYNESIEFQIEILAEYSFDQELTFMSVLQILWGVCRGLESSNSPINRI